MAKGSDNNKNNRSYDNTGNLDDLGFPKRSSKSVKSNKTSDIDLININVKKATKDVKEIFGIATKELSSFHKSYNSTVDKMVSYTMSSYTNMFRDLSKAHSAYLSNMLKKETVTADQIDKIWSKPTKKQIIIDSTGSVKDADPVVNNSRTQNIFNDGFSDFNKSMNDTLNKIMNKYKDESESIKDSNEQTGLLVKSARTFLDIWSTRFFDGMNKIVGTYESTYQNVSVVMNQNQKEYMDWQTKSVNQISEMGLTNNIAISKVMEQLDAVTKMGMSGQKAQNKALSDSITKVIAPYLDVTSDAYTDLQLKLGDRFTNTMNGLGESIREQVGQTRFMSKNINDILTNLTPVFMTARSEVVDKQMADSVAKLEAAVANGSIDSQTAESIKQQWYKLIIDQYGTMQNGSPADIVSLTNMYSQGKDPRDYIDETLEESIKVNRDMINLADKSGPYGTLNQNAVSSNLTSFSPGEALVIGDITNSELEDILNTTAGNPESTAEDLYKNLANDQYNTAKDQKDILAENNSLSAAQFRQTYPDAYKLLESILSSLNFIAGASLFSSGSGFISDLGDKIFGKGASKLFGKGAAAGAESTLKGLGSKLSGGASKLFSTTGARVLGGVGSAVTIGIDAYQGYNKSSDWLGGTNSRQRASSTIGGILGGTGPGVGQGTAVDTGLNIAGGAVKGASLGTLILPGVGTLVGAGVGAVLSAIGGERIAKGADEVAKNLKSAGELLGGNENAFSESMRNMTKQIDESIESLKETHKKIISDIKNLEDEWDKTTSSEEKRRLAIENGIVSEEEASKMSSSELDKKFNDYIQKLKDTEDTRNKVQEAAQKDAEDAAKKKLNDSITQDKDLIINKLKDINDPNELKDKLVSVGATDTQINSILSKSGESQDKSIEAYLRNSDALNKMISDSGDSKVISEKLGLNLTSSKESSEMADYVKKYSESVSELESLQKSLSSTQYGTKEYEETAKKIKDLEGTVNSSRENLGMDYKDYGKSVNSSKGGKWYESYGNNGRIIPGAQLNPSYAVGLTRAQEDATVDIHKNEGILTPEENDQYLKYKTAVPTINDTLRSLKDSMRYSVENQNKIVSSDSLSSNNSDIISVIQESTNNLISAITNAINPNQVDRNNNLLARRDTSGLYDINIASLVPTMPTNR